MLFLIGDRVNGFLGEGYPDLIEGVSDGGKHKPRGIIGW